MTLVNAKHILDYYMDGHIAIPFCKVCSAEGLQLLDPCSKEIPNYEILIDEKEWLDRIKDRI